MNLEILLQALKTYDKNIEERILNVYQFGSRVYGTATEESDWDFIVLVNKSYPYYKLNPLNYMTEEEKNTTHLNPERYGKWEIFGDGDRLNASFIHINDFMREVHFNALESLQIFFIKPEHIWLEKVPLSSLGFELDPSMFCRQVWWEINRTTRVVKSKFRTGELPRAKKNYFFRFRFIMYALQIAKTGRMYDHGEANSIYYDTQQMNVSDMHFMDLVYGSLFEDLWDQFISLVKPYKFYFKRKNMQLCANPNPNLKHSIPSEIPIPIS